eukprot:3391169-Prymnesium_polylepis.1
MQRHAELKPRIDKAWREPHGLAQRGGCLAVALQHRLGERERTMALRVQRVERERRSECGASGGRLPRSTEHKAELKVCAAASRRQPHGERVCAGRTLRRTRCLEHGAERVHPTRVRVEASGAAISVCRRVR